MRNMSFMLTTEQIRNRTKTVTRRIGWWNLKPGELVQACEKCQGLGKGGKINKLCVIRIVSTHAQPLHEILYSPSEVKKEGFPDMPPQSFMEMFMNNMDCPEGAFTEVNRIEFEYV